MSEIKLNCPDCGKEIKIRIKTIDSLREEIKVLKTKVASLERKTENEKDNSGDFPNWFMNNIFKGE